MNYSALKKNVGDKKMSVGLLIHSKTFVRNNNALFLYMNGIIATDRDKIYPINYDSMI
jgi:hypothetical protein